MNFIKKADDVIAFLKSRHGLAADRELVQKAIADLGGDPNPNNEYLEIPMLVSILLVPYLLEEIKKEGSHETNNGDTTESSNEERDSIFEQVLDIIFDDLHIPETARPPLLTPDFVRAAFEKCLGTPADEISETMVQDMIRLADSDVLDAPAFARAMTSDAANYDAAMATCSKSYLNNLKSMSNKLNSSNFDNLKLKETLSAIDMSGDTFQSDQVIVLLLSFTFVTYLAYLSGESWINNLIQCGYTAGWCQVGRAILNWIWIFFQLGLLGTVGFYLMSGGNRLLDRPSAWMTIKQITSIVITAALFVPFFVEDNNFFLAYSEGWALNWARYASFVAAVCFLLLQLNNFGVYLYPNSQFFLKLDCSNKKEADTKLAARFKMNQMVKNSMEMRFRSKGEDSLSAERLDTFQTIEHIQACEELVEPIGGLFWAWKRGKKFREEDGIWYSVRFFAAGVMQIVAICFFCFLIGYSLYFVTTVKRVSTITEVKIFPPRSLYFNASGSYVLQSSEIDENHLSTNNLEFGYVFDDGGTINSETSTVKMSRLILQILTSSSSGSSRPALFGLETIEGLVDNISDIVFQSTGIQLHLILEYVDLYISYEGGIISFLIDRGSDLVSDRDWIIFLVVGGVSGLLGMIFVKVYYNASYWINGILVRQGGEGHFALRDPLLAKIRKEPVRCTQLIGGAFWGILATGLLTAFVIGGIAFLIQWEQTAHYIMPFLAQLAGIIVTLILRIALVMLISKAMFDGLYRKNPVLATLMTSVLEMWNIALSIGIIIGRALKLLLVTILYIGRIDALFLSPQANNLFGINLDKYPWSFGSDMIVHDAHRHPYIERLGLFYMLQIENGDAFISRSGSSWRLMFTLALMPWLRRYRPATLATSQHNGKKDLLEEKPGENSGINVSEEPYFSTSEEFDC